MEEFENNDFTGSNQGAATGASEENSGSQQSSYQENGQTDYSNMSTRDYMNNLARQAQGTGGYTGGNGTNGYANSYGNAYNNQQNGYVQNPYYTQQPQQPQQEVNKKSKKKKVKAKKGGSKAGRFVKKGVGVLAAAAVFGLVAGGIFNYMTDGSIIKNSNDTTQSEVSETESTTESNRDIVIPTTSVSSDGKNDSQSLDVSDIAEGVMPSVVAITIQGVEEVQNFFGQVQQYEVEGAGSGIIIGENDTELLIATNNHVVSDATTVSVQFIDDEVYEAKVKGTDSDNDLAIIVVDLDDISSDTMDSIKIAQLGSSDDLKVGEQVVAIGNALGYGQSVTTGIVSAKDRTVDTNTTPLIQTDAAINPGNSGGALLNMDGEVVGINSSKYASTDVEGMGYAIPISQVEEILDNLMSRETREKVDEDHMGYLGISCSTISEEVSEMYGIPTGVLIQDVTEGSAAEQAGLKKNYIITKFDGQSVSSADELVSKLEYYEAGESVEVSYKVMEDDEYVEKTVKVVLGRKSTSKN